jgi:DNA uptake protein ComE-like DNA-binding protein
MKNRLFPAALAAAILLVGGSQLASAADTKAVAPQQAASKSKTNQSESVAKTKAAATPKLVDINSAKIAELKNLPGISDAEAAKIIAGRPYPTKAHLVTRNILDNSVYDSLKQLVVARQPNKDAAKNAALYSKKK